MAKSRTVIITLVVLIAFIGGAFLFGAAVAFFTHKASGESSGFFAGDRVGLVRIEGGIFESDEIIKQLESFRKDSDIKAIIMRINSPGGSAAASQEIYQAAKKAAAEKPVIASMESVAASGGYYVALGATKILANPSTITGSIGVRMEHVMLKDLLNWAKIHMETLKSGKFKDMGSTDRPLTPEERVLLNTILEDIHNQFKEAVVESRNIDRAQIDKIADGRVFTGREAFALKLVDQLGGYIEAVEVAKELAGIEGDAKVVEKKEFKYEWLKEMFESATSAVIEQITMKEKVKVPLFSL
jgi:protease-4